MLKSTSDDTSSGFLEKLMVSIFEDEWNMGRKGKGLPRWIRKGEGRGKRKEKKKMRG